ncbi:MAG: TRAP transporter small permease subunit [Deltaproteobacteria bacterium]|nr:TRAP transporter small permease subunit [Deltaproteobacteria bacterium]
MSLIDRLSEWSGKIVSYLVIVMMLILLYEIALRSILGKPTLWGYEMAGMLFGAFCVIAGAYTHRYEAHVRMDVIYGTWRPRTQAIADTCTSFLLLLFLVVFLWLSIQNALESWKVVEYSGSAWGPPVYPIKMVIAVGVFLLLMQAVANFIRSLTTAVKGGASHV